MTGQFTYQQNRVVFNKSDSSGLTLGMYFPEKQIMAPMLGIRKWIIVMLITCTGLIIIFTLLTYNNLLLPIYKLIAAMSEVKSGNLKVRISEKHNDEFGFMFMQFNSMINQIDTLINEVYMEHLKQQQAQLKFLQSQINPHFLYNCLNFIYQMVMAENTDGAAKMALFLGRYFRFATKSNKDLVMIKEELDSVDAYINIQQMRYPGKINFHLEVPDSLIDINIPRLIIQPIVENAFVHGLEPSNGPGNIWIKACCERETIKIIIEDDGIGIKPEELDAINRTLDGINQIDHGYGLNNTHWRLKLRFGENAGINIERRLPRGTRVILKIPHENAKEEN
jgi:two-component system sensor histidine kinase YesM